MTRFNITLDESVDLVISSLINSTGGDKRVWKASDIGKLKPWEFEKVEKEIDEARAEGRIDFAS